MPEELNDLASEERHQIYKMLRLQVTVGPDKSPEVSGTFGGNLDFCEFESSSRKRWILVPTSRRGWGMLLPRLLRRHFRKNLLLPKALGGFTKAFVSLRFAGFSLARSAGLELRPSDS